MQPIKIPTPRQIDDAKAIIHYPHLSHDQPAWRANAWEVLKAARGQTVNTARLDAMQHHLRHARGLAAHLLNPVAGAR